MSTIVGSNERFRKGFVLVLTLIYGSLFLAMLSGFVEALLLAAVFSGILYPLYLWLRKALNGRSNLASLLSLVISLAAIIVPLLLLLGLVVEQAVEVTEEVKPWVQQQISESSSPGEKKLPDWIPFADKLAPYREKISAKIAQFASAAGVYLAESLTKFSQGTVVFFLDLFVMLYAVFVFLVHGPALIKKIMSYAPLSKADHDKMLQVGLSVSRATVKGTLIIGIIQGILGGVGFAVAGLDAALFWGAMMAVLSVIPGIGATLIWAPAVIYLLMSGETVAGIGLLVWSVGVVGTVDNFLRPILVGRDTQMPDLLILLSTLGGLTLFGASGLVLGPILAALFMTVLAIYSHVFADWLNPDQFPGENPLPDEPEVVHASGQRRRVEADRTVSE